MKALGAVCLQPKAYSDVFTLGELSESFLEMFVYFI